MSNLESWFIHVVTRRSRASNGAKGDPVYGAQTTFKARVEKRSGFIRGADGSSIAYTHVLATTTQVKLDDSFWFPSIRGEAADDVTSESAARTPVGMDATTNKTGTASLVQLYF